MQSFGRFGWLLALLFAVCCALRLARFNTALEDDAAPAWAGKFFSGVPAPAAAGLVLLPMILSFQVGDTVFRRPEIVALFLICVATLMVSRVPTYAFKAGRIPHRWVLPTMLLVGLLAASIVSAPWITLSVVLFAYIISIPFSIRAYRRLSDGTDTEDPDDDDDEDIIDGEEETQVL